MASEIDSPNLPPLRKSSSDLCLFIPSSSSPLLIATLKIGTDQTLSSSFTSPQTFSAPVMLTSETDLLKPVVPPTASETVVLSPTSEPVTEQIAPPVTFSTTQDGSRVVPVSTEVNNQSLVLEPSQLQQPPIPQVKPPTIPADDLAQAPGKFVPSLGSWAKPLFFKPPVTPPEPSTPRDYHPAIVGNQLAALWPTLNDEILNKQPKGKYPSRTIQPPVEKLPPPELRADGSLRFPWAARLNAQSRNLYRAATPTYRLDGTPEISIPSKVLKLGPENKDEYIIGKFHKCSLPPGGLVHAVVNKIWGRSCKISCKKLGDSSFMFHILHQPTRHWVIQRGVWHIDDCLLFVLPWTPEGSFKVPEISTLPVWATLKNVPDCCYSRLGISHVASGLGEPILTHKPRLDPTSMGEAKILVEMELDKNFPKIIALDDKQGNIFLVDVEYTWIPSMCERCGNLGHKAKRCLLPSSTVQVSASTSPSMDTSSAVPVVDIDTILQQKDNVGSSPPTVHQEELHINESNPPSALDGAALEPHKNIKEIEDLFLNLKLLQLCNLPFRRRILLSRQTLPQLFPH